MEGGSLGSPNLSCLRPSRRLAVGDTAQRSGAATKGARVCDPQELCRPSSVLTNPARRSLSTCCGSPNRVPQNRRGLRRFGQILINYKSALPASAIRVNRYASPLGLWQGVVVRRYLAVVRKPELSRPAA